MTATHDAPPILLTVNASDVGERIDKVLVVHFPDHSRAQVQRWLDAGCVRSAAVPLARADRVRAGMVLELQLPQETDTIPVAEPVPFGVVFEDDAVLVVNKPAGVVVHPAAGHWHGTLVHGLLHHAKTLAPGADPHRPGIVHRLDKDTSGVLVVAKTTAAQQALARQFHDHSIARRYLALVQGHPPAQQQFDTWYGRHPHDRKRFSSRVSKGKRALTQVKVLEFLTGAALVSCTLSTGRTHQIRVHLADAGFPIVADSVYGRTSRDPRLTQAAALVQRQALHAESLGFVHPQSGASLSFRVPVPADMRRAYELLRGKPLAPA